MQQKVKNLLRDNPRLRDSDLALIGTIWELEGLKLTDEQKRVFMTLTTPETITRIRRKLRKQYPGSEAVESVRYIKYKEYRDEYGMPVMIQE